MTGQLPTDYFTRAQIKRLRTRSPWRAWWIIAHCWMVIVGTWVVVAIWTHPLTILFGILVVGGRQLGLAVIGHDGAHHILFKNRKLNDWVSQWLLNRPLLGGSIVPYRNYHLEHHKHTQQPDDPDLKLSAPFPITKSSFLRKVWRDLSGQTGYKQRKALVIAAMGPRERPWPRRLGALIRRFGPNFTINLVFLGGFVAAGVWYLYFLLWVVPFFTWLLLISRIRNIGEHAVVPDNDDRLRNTRTTLAGPIMRTLVAPYWVNYHLEHHLLVSCPCYKLRGAHNRLIEQGYRPRMEVQASYWSMLNMATAG